MTNPYFRDAQRDIDDTRGVLDGPALRNHDKIVEKLNPQAGYDFELTCAHCNTPAIVTIPWDELIVASVPGGIPLNRDNNHPWQYHQGALYPSVYCQVCSNLLQIPITPDKCERYLKSGVIAGAVNPQRIDQVRHHTQQQLAQYRR